MISQQSFAEELANKFGATSVQNIPLRVGRKLDEFDVDEETESKPFRELVGGLMWLAIFDTPRYFQRRSIWCEVPFHAKSHSLENGARYYCVH